MPPRLAKAATNYETRSAAERCAHRAGRYHNYEFASAAFRSASCLPSAAVITGMLALAYGAGGLGMLGLIFIGDRLVRAEACTPCITDAELRCHSRGARACMRRRMRSRSLNVRPARLGANIRSQRLMRRMTSLMRILIGSVSACAQAMPRITQS